MRPHTYTYTHRPPAPPLPAQLLVLDDNQLGDLPEDIGSLRRLERLSVSGNRLRTLPDSIGQLEALQVRTGRCGRGGGRRGQPSMEDGRAGRGLGCLGWGGLWGMGHR